VAAPEPEAPEGEGRWDADQGRFLRPGEVSLADLEAAFLSTEGPEIAAAKPVATAAPPELGAALLGHRVRARLAARLRLDRDALRVAAKATCSGERWRAGRAGEQNPQGHRRLRHELPSGGVDSR
jgi:hypothetical protein